MKRCAGAVAFVFALVATCIASAFTLEEAAADFLDRRVRNK